MKSTKIKMLLLLGISSCVAFAYDNWVACWVTTYDGYFYMESDERTLVGVGGTGSANTQDPYSTQKAAEQFLNTNPAAAHAWVCGTGNVGAYRLIGLW